MVPGDMANSSNRTIPWPRVLVEGVVIVGSILLAFGIDAWWDARKERDRESQLLVGLLGDFETTRSDLEQRLVTIMLQNGMATLMSPDPVAYPNVLQLSLILSDEIILTSRQLANFIVSLVLLVGVSIYVRKTRYGRATRAIAERADVAAAFGVDVDRVSQVTVVLASLMAGMAAVSVGMLYGSAWAFVGFFYGLKAFICMLVAGNRYFEGVIIVALTLGVVEALVTGYVSSSLRDVAAFVILIAVLYVRPNGLFGSYSA